MNAIGNMLRGKRILITGAAGSIGSEMSRQDTGMQIVTFTGSVNAAQYPDSKNLTPDS